MLYTNSMVFRFKKSLKLKKTVFLLFALFFVNAFAYSQSPVAEVYSGRIRNSDNKSAFYFRILDVNQADFDNYYKKSQDFILFKTEKSGYSAEYKIGSIYYSSTKSFNLSEIQSLLKEMGFSKVKYDDAVINVNELHTKTIVTPERNQKNSTQRN